MDDASCISSVINPKMLLNIQHVQRGVVGKLPDHSNIVITDAVLPRKRETIPVFEYVVEDPQDLVRRTIFAEPLHEPVETIALGGHWHRSELSAVHARRARSRRGDARR